MKNTCIYLEYSYLYIYSSNWSVYKSVPLSKKVCNKYTLFVFIQ